MGLILDSSVVIAAERQGHTVRQILEQVQARYGEIDVALSVITIAELTHGAYRAKAEADKQRRLNFIERLASDVPVHPVTIETARMVGRIEGLQAAQGITIGFEDLAIGATAFCSASMSLPSSCATSSVFPASRSSPLSSTRT